MAAFFKFVIIDGFIMISLFYLTTILIGITSQTVSKRLQKKLQQSKNPVAGYLFSTTFGAITPFCSATTIPMFTGFLKTGVGFGYAMSFLVASPIVNEIAFILMVRFKGVGFALEFLFLTCAAAMTIGFVFSKSGKPKNLKVNFQRQEETGSFLGTDDNKIPFGVRLRTAHLMSMIELKRCVGYLAVGIITGGVIYGFVPETAIHWVSNNIPVSLQVPVMAVLGAPLYLTRKRAFFGDPPQTRR